MVKSGIYASVIPMIFFFLECVLCTDDIMIFSVCREDVRIVNVIAAGEVTCLVIDRE